MKNKLGYKQIKKICKHLSKQTFIGKKTNHCNLQVEKNPYKMDRKKNIKKNPYVCKKNKCPLIN